MKTYIEASRRIACYLGLVLGLLSAGITPVLAAPSITVIHGDTQGLIDAVQTLNNTPGGGFIDIISDQNGAFPPFEFTNDFNGNGSALPDITAPIRMGAAGFPPVYRGNGSFRFAKITGSGRLTLIGGGDIVEQFGTQGMGGAFLVLGGGELTSLGVEYRGNFAGQGGGAVAAMDAASLDIKGGSFTENRTDTVGGAVKLTGTSTANVERIVFLDNQATVFGCDLDVESTASAAGSILIADSVFLGGNCGNVRIENPTGAIDFRNNTFGGLGGADAIDSTGSIGQFANIFSIGPAGPKSLQIKAVCNDFGSNAFQSQGYNISSEASCKLTQPTDLPNTDPMTAAPDADGIIGLLPGSPAIDSGASALVDLGGAQLELPCGIADARGLGRPQDANDDGVFECDRGGFEVQGGPDIGPPQSAAFFDPARNGEGVFIEMLPDRRVWVSVFTFAPGGNGMAWWVGLGESVGNSVVVNEMDRTSGGVFGATFDPDNIVLTPAGGLSLVFPSCEAVAKPGRLAFQADAAGGFEDLLVTASRLSSVLDCSGPKAASASSGRSGSFYDPARSGEGVIVEWLTDGTALLIFYTYDAQGNQFWTISDTVSINGSTLTANMLYPETTTSFGAAFDANEISMATWGTITLEYQPGCNAVKLSYDSVVSGFGAGSYDYKRLTNVDGTSCDL